MSEFPPEFVESAASQYEDYDPGEGRHARGFLTHAPGTQGDLHGRGVYENWLDELPGRASLAIASRVSGIARDNVDLMRIQATEHQNNRFPSLDGSMVHPPRIDAEANSPNGWRERLGPFFSRRWREPRSRRTAGVSMGSPERGMNRFGSHHSLADPASDDNDSDNNSDNHTSEAIDVTINNPGDAPNDAERMPLQAVGYPPNLSYGYGRYGNDGSQYETFDTSDSQQVSLTSAQPWNRNDSYSTTRRTGPRRPLAPPVTESAPTPTNNLPGEESDHFKVDEAKTQYEIDDPYGIAGRAEEGYGTKIETPGGRNVSTSSLGYNGSEASSSRNDQTPTSPLTTTRRNQRVAPSFTARLNRPQPSRRSRPP